MRLIQGGLPQPSAIISAAALLFVTSSALATPAAENRASASSEPGGAEGNKPSDPEVAKRRAEFRALRDGAAERLEADVRAQLESMSDEAVIGLIDATDDSAATEAQKSIRGALWKQAFESELRYQTGDISIGDGLATLHLGREFRYLNEEDAEKLLVQGWGNPPGTKSLGMIVPANLSPLHGTRGWAVVVTYSEDGYVDDDDAEDIDYDDLLKSMQEDTLAANEQRRAEGYGEITLKGWAAPPHYDADTHRLYWAKELQFAGAPENTLNYAIRVLGRKGVLELNAVAGMGQLSVVKRDMEQILPRAEFEVGARYADFDPEIDEVAAYGIGGLIAGKALLKVGFFAGLLKVLLAMKKLLIFGVIGVGGLLAKYLGGRKKS